MPLVCSRERRLLAARSSFLPSLHNSRALLARAYPPAWPVRHSRSPGCTVMSIQPRMPLACGSLMPFVELARQLCFAGSLSSAHLARQALSLSRLYGRPCMYNRKRRLLAAQKNIWPGHQRANGFAPSARKTRLLPRLNGIAIAYLALVSPALLSVCGL